MKRVARLLVSCCAVASVALLSAASAQAPSQADCATAPSKLDYLVMASMADSSGLMGLSVPQVSQKR